MGGWGEAWGGGPWRAGKGGDGGGGALVPFFGSLKNLTTRDEGGGMGGGVGRWPMEDGQEGDGGGGALVPFLGSLKNLTTRDEGGGMGGGVGRWPMEGGQGGRWGGHQRAVWEQQKVHWFPFLGSLKNLTTAAGAKAWGGWPREEMGAPESS